MRKAPDKNTALPPVDFSAGTALGLRGRLASNTGLLGGSRILAALMGALTLYLAYKGLGSDAAFFGTLLFIHAYMLFFAEVASFQIWQALIRFGADDIKAARDAARAQNFEANSAGGRPTQRFAQLLRTGLVIDAVAAVVAFLLAIGLFEIFAALQSRLGFASEAGGLSPDQLRTYVMAYCTVILLRQVNVAIGVFRLFDRFSVLALRALVMPGVRLIGVVTAIQLGWGLVGFLGVWYAASALSYIVLQIFAAREVFRRNLWPHLRRAKLCKRADFPGLYSFIVKTNIDSTLKALRANFPSIAIMLLFGPALLAVYRVADEIARLLSRGVTLFDQVLFPELARMAADLDLRGLMRTSAKAALGIGALGLGVSVVVIVFGPTLLAGLFDSDFKPAAQLAALLLLAGILLGMATPFYSVFYALMRPGAAIIARAIGVVVFIGCFFALSDRLGLMSVGWAAIIGAGVEGVLSSLWASLMIRRDRARLTLER